MKVPDIFFRSGQTTFSVTRAALLASMSLSVGLKDLCQTMSRAFIYISLKWQQHFGEIPPIPLSKIAFISGKNKKKVQCNIANTEVLEEVLFSLSFSVESSRQLSQLPVIC